MFVFFWFFVFWFFLGGFKGQVRWPEGPPHLALNPPYLLFVFCCFCCFCFFVLFFFEGLRVRWGGPKNPPYLLFFCFSFCCFWFLSFLCFYRKTLLFPLKRHFMFYFLCFSFFLPQPFLTSPFFNFSFSVSLLFFCFFIPSCLSSLLSFCFLVFVSFFPFLSSLLLFHEKNNSNIFNCNLFFFVFWIIFSFLGFFLVFFQIPFSYLCYFLILSYVFCSTWLYLVSKQTT